MQLQKDPEFKDYMAAHTRKGQIWDNDAGDDISGKASEGGKDDEPKDDEDEEGSDGGSGDEATKKGSVSVCAVSVEWWIVIYIKVGEQGLAYL